MPKEHPLPAYYESYSAYEAADIILAEEEKKKPKPSLDQFEDVAGSEKIKKDREKLTTILDRIQKEEREFDPAIQRKLFEQKKISEAFEVTVLVHGEESEWFGSNALTTRTTEFDDVLNGVDVIIEFNAGKKEDGEVKTPPRLALAIDATTDTESAHINKKINNNIEKILGTQGKTATVEYFESQITNERKQLNYVIPVVIGLEQENAKEILLDYANLITIETLSKNISKEKYKEPMRILRKKIEKHPAQRIFLEEIKAQLNHYQSKLTLRNNDRDKIYKEKIGELLSIIDNIEKEKTDIKFGNLTGDAVYEMITKPRYEREDYPYS